MAFKLRFRQDRCCCFGRPAFDFQQTVWRLCPELPSKVNLEILAANTKIAEAWRVEASFVDSDWKGKVLQMLVNCSSWRLDCCLTDLCYPFVWMWPTLTMPRGTSRSPDFERRTQTSSSNIFLAGLNYLPGFVSLNALQLTVLGRSSNENPFEIGESWDKLNHQFAVSANQSIMIDFGYHNKRRHHFGKKGRVKTTHWEILQLQHIFHKKSSKQDTTRTNHKLTTLWWLPTHCLASSTQELIYVFRAKLTTSSHSIPNQVRPGVWFSDGFGMIDSIEKWWFLKPTFARWWLDFKVDPHILRLLGESSYEISRKTQLMFLSIPVLVNSLVESIEVD